jgi:hypothetical protein
MGNVAPRLHRGEHGLRCGGGSDPGLHRRPELRDTAFQALLIALGIGSIAAVRLLLAH